MAHAHLIEPSSKVDLDKLSTKPAKGTDKAEAQAEVERLGERLEALQELLFAASTHSLLVVLQGRDTSGKDGAIKRILQHTNVQSTRVVPFKQPTAQELAHDFLWRVHPHCPERGGISIFNRSHYEDVLVVRVHDLVPKATWQARYEHINAFERLIVDANTIVVKFLLHITKEEQEERLLAREADPTKGFKLAVGDWKERELWDEYTEAFEDALRKCSTEVAPWRVVPADAKWYRDLAIFQTLVEVLEPFEKTWRERLNEIGAQAKRELAEYRK